MTRILSPPQGSGFLPSLTLRWGPKTTQEVGKRKLGEPLSSAQSQEERRQSPISCSHTHCIEVGRGGTLGWAGCGQRGLGLTSLLMEVRMGRGHRGPTQAGMVQLVLIPALGTDSRLFLGSERQTGRGREKECTCAHTSAGPHTRARAGGNQGWLRG